MADLRSETIADNNSPVWKRNSFVFCLDSELNTFTHVKASLWDSDPGQPEGDFLGQIDLDRKTHATSDVSDHVLQKKSGFSLFKNKVQGTVRLGVRSVPRALRVNFGPPQCDVFDSCFNFGTRWACRQEVALLR